MGTNLAQAYVQVVPSAKGIKGSLQNVLAPEADSAGRESGGILGSSLTGKLKTIIAAAGIGKAISSSITAGGDLQQSLGGIETLFKGSADKVKGYANEAFRTTGLSANAYMENVTGFSASLLQSLGGDTDKAAEVANMAMIDMSDNANKMGTDMESIQYAYQGFAKQNYTMLDNLKLGYGGTKSEMERLLADAEALTGVHYDISNLSDVYEAVHVVQTELGITGTTAKEASETFTGSFNAMKASVTDLLGNLSLGADIGPSLENLKETVHIFLIDNLIPMIGNIVMNLPTLITGVAEIGGSLIETILTGVTESLPNVIAKGFEFLNNFITGIITGLPNLILTVQTLISSFIAKLTESLPMLVERGGTMIVNLITGILSNLPNLITSAFTLTNGFISKITEMLPSILQKGCEIVLQLVNGIISNLPQIITSALESVTSFISTIGENLPSILQTGIEILGELAAGLIDAIPDLVAKIPEIVTSMIDAFFETDWLQVGLDIIEGIAQGLANAGHKLWEAVKGVLGSFKDNVLEFFGIHSPSRWGKFVGQMVDEGIAIGLSDVAPINKAVEDIQSAVAVPITANTMLEASTGMSASTARQNENAEIIDLLKQLLGRKEEIVINCNDREVARALREMGVAFG